jgi:hypothetical protein
LLPVILQAWPRQAAANAGNFCPGRKGRQFAWATDKSATSGPGEGFVVASNDFCTRICGKHFQKRWWPPFLRTLMAPTLVARVPEATSSAKGTRDQGAVLRIQTDNFCPFWAEKVARYDDHVTSARIGHLRASKNCRHPSCAT